MHIVGLYWLCVLSVRSLYVQIDTAARKLELASDRIVRNYPTGGRISAITDGRDGHRQVKKVGAHRPTAERSVQTKQVARTHRRHKFIDSTLGARLRSGKMAPEHGSPGCPDYMLHNMSS